MKRVLFQSQATEEFEDAISYYEAQKPGLGRELRKEVEWSVNQIQRYPSLGARYKDTSIRRLTLRRFPYLLFYLETTEVIWIIAVAHGSRKPGYWQDRKIVDD